MVEALLATLAVSIFAVVMSKTNQDFYAITQSSNLHLHRCNCYDSSACFIFLDEHDSKLDKNKTKDKHVLKKDLLEILRNKNIWLCTICIICGYQLFLGYILFFGISSESSWFWSSHSCLDNRCETMDATSRCNLSRFIEIISTR